MRTFFYAPWKWLVSVPGILLGTLVWGILCLVCLTFLPPRRVNRFIPVFWARTGLAVIPAPVTVVGREHLDPHQSYILVANHLSHMDILALYGNLGIDLRWVMKRELRKVPVIGITCAGLGHVFIDRSKRHEALRALNEAKPRLAADGASLIFFPEGTRSVDGLLHGFKKGAFVTAKDMSLPILPITLRGTFEVLPAKTLDLLPGRIEIVIHRPIAVEQVMGRSVDDLMTESRAVIASALPADRVAAD